MSTPLSKSQAVAVANPVKTVKYVPGNSRSVSKSQAVSVAYPVENGSTTYTFNSQQILQKAKENAKTNLNPRKRTRRGRMNRRKRTRKMRH